MDTTLGKDISNAGAKAKLDEYCNRLMANKYILSYVMRDCMLEYKDCEIEDIIRFSAKVPKKSDKEDEEAEDIRLIVVVEPQDDFYPGYPILKRATYYYARAISAQKGTVFTGKQYGKIQKVYVVFVCMMPPQYAQNTITRYSMQEENVVGQFHAKREDYDLASVIMVCLGSHERKKNDLLRLLNVLLSQELNPTAKKQILADEYQIPMTHDIEEGVENMGSLWDRAVAKGVDKGILDCLYKYINRKKVSIDEALEDHDIPSASRQQYSMSLNKMLGTGV